MLLCLVWFFFFLLKNVDLLRRRDRDEAAAMEYRGGGPEGEAQLLGARMGQG